MRCFRPAAEDGILVRILRSEGAFVIASATHVCACAVFSILAGTGAIPFVRTNVPQCLMLPESANAIWGIAKNVYNRARS